MSKKLRQYLQEMVSTSTIDFYTTDKEVLREAILAEYDAANLYLQMAQKVRSQEVRRVLEHVAAEEKAHIGEFEALLEKLDTEHEKQEDKGEEEVKDMGISLGEADEKMIYNKIREFFKKNPNPSDKQVHNFAKELGIDEHKFEEYIYKLLSSMIKKE